jgi:hypothetical protein
VLQERVDRFTHIPGKRAQLIGWQLRRLLAVDRVRPDRVIEQVRDSRADDGTIAVGGY